MLARCAVSCDVCSAASASSKARAGHIRRAHGCRMSARVFTGADCACPVCGMVFPNRQTALAHLAEMRSRGTSASVPCGCVLQSGCWAPLPADVVASLDAFDRDLRTAARRRGWTQLRSVGCFCLCVIYYLFSSTFPLLSYFGCLGVMVARVIIIFRK